MEAPACAVLSLTDWHPQKSKNQKRIKSRHHICSLYINTEHFKNGGTSLCSPISNRLAPPKE